MPTKPRKSRKIRGTILTVGPHADPATHAPASLHYYTSKTGAVRRATIPSRIDLIPTELLLALGERYHYGATVRGYGERNWEKGLPYANLIQHMAVHLFDLAAQLVSPNSSAPNSPADTPRDNAAAIAWGAAAIIYFLTNGNPAETSP